MNNKKWITIQTVINERKKEKRKKYKKIGLKMVQNGLTKKKYALNYFKSPEKKKKQNI